MFGKATQKKCVCVIKLNIEHTVDWLNAIMKTLRLKKADAVEEIKVRLQLEIRIKSRYLHVQPDTPFHFESGSSPGFFLWPLSPADLLIRDIEICMGAFIA